MSTPASTCCRTISATARCTRASKTAGSGGVPASSASNVAARSGGRGRLPVWVVRIRSVLRFMVDCSSVSPHAGLWYAYDGPPGGDPGRQMTPLLPVGAEQLSLPFVHANLNKRSIVLDVQQPQDQERFRALAMQADVVVSTEGVATWASRGVDLNWLCADFPRLGWTSLPPFGLSGP